MRYSLIPFFLIIVVFSAFAQKEHNKANDDRPKIGLVLSGGAAKGIAHVGVLKVLEEVGIRPDYITGTSMGAIAGGLYALGYSVKDLEELARDTDWDKVLTDRVPLNKIVMEEKEDFERYLLELPIRDYEFKLPSGLTQGYQLDRLFADLTWGATDIQNYDSLPIPFHCMAVDIIEGRAVEFSSGHLATSLRSSMAIPGVFAPVRIDSMLLVDGGIIRNLPVQEVIDMGADYVIAVYVGFEGDLKPEDIYSLSEVLTRTTIFLGVIDSKQQMKLADMVITPNMKGVTATDFFNSDTIVDRGENAALIVKEQLKKLADSLNLTFEPVEKPEGPEFIYVSDVEVENLEYVEKSFIIGQGMIFPGTYTSKKEIDNAVERIYGTRYFKNVGFRLDHIEGIKYKLIYQTTESSRAHFKIAPHYSNQTGTGITMNTTLRNFIISSSRIKFTADIAENPGIRFNLHKYFGKEQHVMGHAFTWWNRAKLPVYYQGQNVGSLTHGLLQAGLGAKYSVNFNQQFGLDFLFERNLIKPGGAVKTFYPEADFDTYVLGGLGYRLNYKLNTLNEMFFSTSGTQIKAQIKRIMKPVTSYSINGDNNMAQEVLSLDPKPFNTFYFNIDQYFELNSTFSFGVGTSIGLTSKETPISNHFALGGIMYTDKFNYESFYGLNFGEQITPNFWKAQAIVNLRVIPRIFFTAAGNVAITKNKVDDFFTELDSTPWQDYLKGYAAGLRIDSFLGPLVFMVGDFASDARTRWYVSLGYTF